jgi:hypothetical protein
VEAPPLTSLGSVPFSGVILLFCFVMAFSFTKYGLPSNQYLLFEKCYFQYG